MTVVCGGLGGVPRPGADPYAGFVWVQDVAQIPRFREVPFRPAPNGSYVDPQALQEWLDDSLGAAAPNAGAPLWSPDENGGPGSGAGVEDFCHNGPPMPDEIQHWSANVRSAAAFLLHERWYANCACSIEPSGEHDCQGQCPGAVYSLKATSKISESIRGEYLENVDIPCEISPLVGPFLAPTYEEQRIGEVEYHWYQVISDANAEQPQTTYLSPILSKAFYPRITLVSFTVRRCDSLPDECCPPRPIPGRPFPPGRTLPPGDRPPVTPLPDPPAVIFIPDTPPEPPMSCQFTEDCRTQLAKVHELLGPDEFPASLPETLFDPTREGQVQLGNYAKLLEWFIVQFDGLLGNFPLEIAYKNAEGVTQSIQIENLAEATAEMIGILLNISADSEIAVQLGFKATTESIRAVAASTLAADYAKANADFLGYRAKETTSDMPLSISPGALSLKAALTESVKKMQRFRFDDNQDLQDFLRQLIIGVGIVKAALQRPLTASQDNDLLPGEGIRDDRNPTTGQTSSDTAWEEFLNQVEIPLSRQRRDPNLPTPKARDIEIGPEEG